MKPLIERNRDYYLRLKREFEPENIRLVIVAESPPASGKCFYDPTGSTKEPLFAALMGQLRLSPITKETGLFELQERGWVLVDATYEAVDKLAKDTSRDRDEIIARDYLLAGRSFDAKAISFVAVTQQFNTTTSMGRLTLNVLLSFAQFERELSSERVRDKVAASRRKGKWTGGTVPLGYDAEAKKLIINKGEAETVRYIFRRYLELQSFGKLVEDLDAKGIIKSAGTPRSRNSTAGFHLLISPIS